MSTPALPLLGAMQLWLHVGWALVLAGAAAGVLAWLPVPRWLLRGLPVALGLWALMPGPWSASYWLGLAFQAPSGVLALACAWWGWGAVRPARAASVLPPVSRALPWEAGLVPAGLLLGWALLLDTFAQWPVALYPLGFDTEALAALLGLGLLPLLQAGAVRRVSAWLVPAALALHVGLRLPTGNALDAVLDPWLWLGLHGLALRWISLRWWRKPQGDVEVKG
jgi:hypothetical protein